MDMRLDLADHGGVAMGLMGPAELLGEPGEMCIMDAEPHEMRMGRDHIVAAAPLIAMAAAYMVEELRLRQAPGVMGMRAVHHIGEGRDVPAVDEDEMDLRLAIDIGALAPGEIGARCLPIERIDAEADPDAGTATVEAEHQARPLGRAALAMRIEAE